MEISNLIKSWSEKLGTTEDVIKKDFNKVAEETKSNFKGLSDDELQQRTLKVLSLKYKKQLRSPAIGFEGIVIGINDAVDTVAKTRKEAIEFYKTDPQMAIAQGVVNEDGIPLDVRKEWANGKPNQNYGKPLPTKNLLRNIFGIALKSNIEGEAPRYFTMSVSGNLAEKENYPLFKPTRFRAIDRTPPEVSDKMYILNSSTYSEFMIDEDISLPNFDILLKKCLYFVNIKDLESYHQQNKENFNRIVAVIGDVVSLNLQPTSIGRKIMTITDGDNLQDLDSKDITCWIPERVDIDFAEGSKVIVIGRTAQGFQKDEQGNKTDELGNVSINIFGLYPIPEFKISLPSDIQDITEENLQM